eukprot:558979-Prymnesium_polylepis.1
MPSPGMPSGAEDTMPPWGGQGCLCRLQWGWAGTRALSSEGESGGTEGHEERVVCLLYTSPSPRDAHES